MTTTSDRLALLQRTKAGQRALLEGMYPDLDFNTVPFREYGRLFTGRKYVPGFVGGWKAYGRSNSEDASTRDILPDYSGNGRDISLYNFAFSGMSGYGGYSQDIGEYRIQGPNEIEGETFIFKATSAAVQFLKPAAVGHERMKLRVKGLTEIIARQEAVRLRVYDSSSQIIKNITEDGTYDLEFDIAEGTQYLYLCLMANDTEVNVWKQLSTPVTAELLPEYPGGLVSDGVDDYGECVKGFALPDDYTVVVVRRIIEGHVAAFASKGSSRGAFLFEVLNNTNKRGVCWSYGQTNSLADAPDLFSYQTKGSYNGKVISYGTAEDSMDDAFSIFRYSAANHMAAVLYDLRIYDHSLTAEELQLVKDEMMEDYEKATGGGIADIHYVADWDGKGRSNDEEEPMRSTWTDKATGKVIDLHNYAFAGMSGWGGYGQNFSAWVIINSTPYQGDLITVNANTIHIKGTFSEGYNRSGMRLDYAPLNTEEKFFLKVLGLKDGQQLYIIDETPDVGKSYIIDSDGIADIVFTTASTTSKPNPKLYIYVQITTGAETVDVTIEQQPIYPGALVSDGVDDYGETQEVINEEVGTMLVFADEELTVGTYIMRSINATPDAAGGIVCRYYNNYIYMGRPDTNVDTLAPLFVLTRTPDSPNYIMVVGAGGYSYGFGKSALYRLILIREQLDGAQVEFLRWKVEKEYRDWCRENGYEYAMNQLTE